MRFAPFLDAEVLVCETKNVFLTISSALKHPYHFITFPHHHRDIKEKGGTTA